MKNANVSKTKAPIAKPNAERIWKQFEDHLIPRLRLSVIDRAVYSHLLRHSRLEGKRRLRFSLVELARRLRISRAPVSDAVRRLTAYGVLRLLQRNNSGHVIEVRVPHEISFARPEPRSVRGVGRQIPPASLTGRRFSLQQTDFFKSGELRRAIHAREAGFCFYCMRRLRPSTRCLDHVIPRVNSGLNSYRNLVSCCLDCNSQKGQQTADNFLRWLYREQRLTADELKNRLAALSALTVGELVPRLP